ncbi:MAG: S-methyl-5-thioribose-1-phosphate isomerase [Methanocellales archaeon]
MRTIEWSSEENCIIFIDQTELPRRFKVKKCRSISTLREAIINMRIRGAPALGAAGAYGIALAAWRSEARSARALKLAINKAAFTLKTARPTAVNLSWAIERLLKKLEKLSSIEEIKKTALEEAKKIAEEDVEVNKLIGKHGAELLKDGDTILTYCNAGRLACVDFGTALGVVRSAIQSGKKIKVIACETRPLNQGSRLTAWELMEDGIPVKLIVDSAAGFVMKQGMIDKVIVGADRIVRNGVFNKIGTYSLSVLAKEHSIPFYIAAPLSSFDFYKSASEVLIEERDAKELKFFGKYQIAPLDVEVYNPAFDVTPLENITAVITEKGVFDPLKMFEVLKSSD